MTLRKLPIETFGADFADQVGRCRDMKMSVALLAEWLTGFTPETCFWIFRFASHAGKKNVPHLVAPACLYLAAHACQPMSRDAARVFNLCLLGEIEIHGAAARKFYEDYVGTIEAVSESGNWNSISKTILKDLVRINELFSPWILQSKSGITSDLEWRRIAKSWLIDLAGEIPVRQGIEIGSSGLSPKALLAVNAVGCLVIVGIVIAMIWIIVKGL